MRESEKDKKSEGKREAEKKNEERLRETPRIFSSNNHPRSEVLKLWKSDRSGRPSKIDNEVLRSMLENNSYQTSQEIAEEFGIHHTIVGDHIKSLGFVLKRSVWVPHELTEKNLSNRVRMYSSHLIRHNVEPFLDKLITEDEK
ncbi:histone-lysine N-methyltransferase SETMAR [Trichonephila clavipes]|nr:histone-lysine N-methyltransferase SETMAR [Trichonephila clavipes]